MPTKEEYAERARWPARNRETVSQNLCTRIKSGAKEAFLLAKNHQLEAAYVATHRTLIVSETLQGPMRDQATTLLQRASDALLRAVDTCNPKQGRTARGDLARVVELMGEVGV